ncbi:MAG: hypothetical protein ACRDSS_09880, partial [Actinocrinis sp.]
ASHPLPRVHFWSIWNEPNFGSDLAPQAIDHGQVEVSPRIYRGLLGAAWKALHATGHGHDTMLFGELAPAGVTGPGEPHDFNMMAGLRFLRALYCVDSSLQPLTGSAAAVRGCPATASASARFRAANPALFEASGLADHPYGFGLAPDQLSVGEPDYTNLAAIPKLESTLDSLQQAYGSQRKLPIWSTEFGYLTRPPDPDPAAFPPKTAAYYINWAEYLTWLDPRIQSYDQYLLKDPPDGLFSTGLETANGAPKPAFDAFRMPLFLPVRSGPATRPLLVWGGVRPAPVITASDHTTQYVQVQFSSGGGAPFKTLSRVQITNPHGYFEIRQKFASSGQVRLAWTPPGGSTEHSRTAQINLH